METILGREIDDKNKFEETYKIEADVIVTAVALGFIGARYHLNQPCQFDYEHPSPEQYDKWKAHFQGKNVDDIPKEYKEFWEDYQSFEHVLSAMSYVLDKSDKKLGAFLKDGQSPVWSSGALITGRAGGQMLKGSERHKEMQGEMSRRLAKLVAEKPGWAEVYIGKGAYTGMIDDPVNDEVMIRPTKRVIDNDSNRWHPGQGYVNWGLIKGPAGKEDINLRAIAEGGMGPLPQNVNKPGRIGYIHGMSSAIAKCVSSGAWCTPYELATGDVTTKMASCFACTTYMYATGFPPSSTHLGRGESWVPPAPHLVSGEKDDTEMPVAYEDSVIRSLATRWHWEIYHYLRLGSSYLRQTGVDRYVNSSHADSVAALSAALERLEQAYFKKTADIGKVGGNLFLDALTVHDSDWKRIERTLRPAINELLAQQAHRSSHS